MNYEQFIKELDVKLANYFELHKAYIHCKSGCSACCEKPAYPILPSRISAMPYPR